MNDQNRITSLEELSRMSAAKAADVLMRMTPREAGELLDAMEQERYFLVQKEIFERDFKFHGSIAAEAIVNALNASAHRK